MYERIVESLNRRSKVDTILNRELRKTYYIRASYPVDSKLITAKWIRKMAELHRKSADELEAVADYMEEHKLKIMND